MTGNFIAVGGESGVAESVAVESVDEQNVTASGADVTGDLTNLGTATQADVYVQWRKTASGSFTWQTTSVQTISSTGEFTATINLLIDGGVVDWRAVADGDNGTSDVGATRTFRATDGQLAVTTDPASGVSKSGATMHGTLDDLGANGDADIRFEFRQTGESFWRDRDVGIAFSAPESFSYELDSLPSGTEYEYRITAEAGGQTVTGTPETFTTETDTVAGDDLVAWYKLDAGSGTTATDYSGNGRDGSINGASWVTDAKTGGQALSFNSSDTDSVSIGLPRMASAFTCTFWTKAPNQTDTTIVESADGNEFQFERDNGPSVNLKIADESANTIFLSGGVSNDTWTHVAGTWDGATARLYIGGGQVDSTSISSMDAQGVGDAIGRSTGGSADAYDGLVDDVRFYDTALSQSQIQDIINEAN